MKRTLPPFRRLIVYSIALTAFVAIGVLSWRYLDARIESYKQAKALEQCQAEAEAGDTSAMVRLGYKYRFGLGVIEDKSLAMEWFRKAAELGNTDGMLQIASMYYLPGFVGVQKDIDKGIEWYLKAAEHGSGAAMYQLGEYYSSRRFLYESGGTWPESGQTWDEYLQAEAEAQHKAYGWYYKAAQHHVVPAKETLGDMYAEGRGAAKDEIAAFRWYSSAAARQPFDIVFRNYNRSRVYFKLGKMYAEGRGTERDEARAVVWYRKAAEEDSLNTEAMYELGVMYANGRGVPLDYEEAVKWWRKGARYNGWPVSVSCQERLDELGEDW